MDIEYPPRKKQDHLGVLLRNAADDVLPLRQDNADGVESSHRDEEFLDILSAALEEAKRPQEEPSHGEDNEARLLLKKNAWLRKLAIRLSNLLGDVPRRE